MLDVPVATTLGFGFVLGLRHALEADHLAAVASLSGPRDGLRRALARGISWGLGHATAIGAAGGAAVALRRAFPERLSLAFEFVAALMLILLGARSLRGALRDRVHVHEHRHDGSSHAHLHFHAARHAAGEVAEHRHPHAVRLAVRPFLVGSVHGLAGSGALALLVLTTVPTVLAGGVYLAVFGAGSILGMMLMSLALAAPFAIAARRAAWLSLALRAAAGVGSLGLGAALVWRLGAAARLLG